MSTKPATPPRTRPKQNRADEKREDPHTTPLRKPLDTSPHALAQKLGLPRTIPALDISAYDWKGRLGRGASSRVLLATTPEGEEVAGKKFTLTMHTQ
jgi:hypothetical protein